MTTQSERLHQASNAHASAKKRDPKIKSWDFHFVGYVVVGHLPSWIDNILKHYTTGQHLSQSAIRIHKNAKNLREREEGTR